MKYFLTMVDSQYVAPAPIGWYGKLDRKSWRDKKTYEMPKHMLFQVEKNMQMVFTDIITFPCFMVSKKVRDVILQYDSWVKFIRIILYDKIRKKSMAYYMPFLAEIKPINTKKIGDMNFKSIVINSLDIEHRTIVEINCTGRSYVAMRIDLLESILRREPIGFGLNAVSLKTVTG